MPVLSLTDATLRALKTDKRQTFFDSTTPGFGVRCTPTGVKTFVIVYGPENARRWEAIGRYDPRHLTLAMARKKGGDRLAAIRLGIQSDKPVLGFKEAYDEFLAVYKAKNRPKTVYEMERIVGRHLLPKLRHKMAADITTADLNAIIDKLLPTRAECLATFTATRTLFRWLARRRSIPRSPLENVPAPVAGTARTRVLTSDELVAIWKACDSLDNINPELAQIVKLLILTGQRKGQIAKLCGEWIDREAQLITWPADAMKGKRGHTLPLAPHALAIVMPLAATGFVFRARGKDTPFNGFSKCKAAFDQRVSIPPWTLHDLRRTFSTGLAKLKIPPHIKEMILAHKTAKDPVEAIYDLHTYEEEMRDALQAWEAHVQALLSTPESTNGANVSGIRNERAQPATRRTRSRVHAATRA